MKRHWVIVVSMSSLLGVLALVGGRAVMAEKPSNESIGAAMEDMQQLVASGQRIFRFDTFGDEAYWGGELHLDEAIAGLSPSAALGLGLKIDAESLSHDQLNALKHGHLDMRDPAVTVQLIRQNAVLGVAGFFDSHGRLSSVGLTCALCHSTVDDSVVAGVGRRIDGIANRDMNSGAIIAAAPNLRPIAELLSMPGPTVTVDQLRAVLLSWGPGKFDAEIFLDGKAFQPDGRSAAALIPNSRGLAGFNLETWTGGWGALPYWDAFVAVVLLHGNGTFFDARFDNAAQFPVAAAAGLGHISVDPDDDRVTSKLPALELYQLTLRALRPRPGVDFNEGAAARGDELFSGKANCNRCHHEPLWTEPGWNTHPASDLRIDSFEADRAPEHSYKTMNLAGIFQRERGLFMRPENRGHYYHDGRFHTLLDVVQSYNTRFGLGLSGDEEHDVVEYLKSL